MPAGARPERFVTLDGMRGIAALAVAEMHFNPSVVPGAYLAVDFFFALSGFVLWKAYSRDFAEDRLNTARFFALRAVRLYPLYALGFAVAVLFVMQRDFRGIETGNWDLSGTSFVLSSLMLPTPNTDALFPLNVPSWSLFFELLANLLMALVVAWITWRRAASLALVSTVIMIFCVWLIASHVILLPKGYEILIGINYGYTWPTFYLGLLRVMASFPIGLALASLTVTPRTNSAAAIGLCTILGLSMFVSGEHLWRLGFDGLFVLFVSPLLILLGAKYAPHPRIDPIAKYFGSISYAVYALHVPMAPYIISMSSRLGLTLAISNVLYVIILLVAATLATLVYDKPIRRFLVRRMKISGH